MKINIKQPIHQRRAAFLSNASGFLQKLKAKSYKEPATNSFTQIEILVHNQANLSVRVPLNTTIKGIKKYLERSTSILSSDQIIIFCGKILKDNVILPSNIIETNSDNSDALESTSKFYLCLVNANDIQTKFDAVKDEEDDPKETNFLPPINDRSIPNQNEKENTCNNALENIEEKINDKSETFNDHPNKESTRKIKCKFNLEEELKKIQCKFNLEEELEKIQCEEYAEALTQAGFDDHGAFANMKKEEIMSDPFYINAAKCEKIVELSKKHHEKLEIAFEIKSKNTIIQRNEYIKEYSSKSNDDRINYNNRKSNIKSIRYKCSKEFISEADSSDDCIAKPKKSGILHEYLNENIPAPSPLLSDYEVINKWMKDFENILDNFNLCKEYISKDRFFSELMKWMKTNIKIEILQEDIYEIKKNSDRVVQSVMKEMRSQTLWIHTAFKETRKTLFRILATQKRRTKFLEELRSFSDKMKSGEKVRCQKIRKEQSEDVIWIINGKKIKRYLDPSKCPRYEEDYFDKRKCMHCSYAREAH